MDPISATASCITIVQIFGTVVSLFSTSRHALENINSITSELDSLKNILQGLEDQASTSVILEQTMDRCKKDLNALRQKLEKINRSSDRKKRWRWIFVKDEVTEVLDRIRGMRGNLHLAITISQSALTRSIHEQTVVSITSLLQQHHLESSARQQELLSLANSMVVPQYGYFAPTNCSHFTYPGHPPLFPAKWTQKQIFNFVLFDILIRTDGLGGCGRSIDDEKQLQKPSRVLIRFSPSTLLAWLVDTIVIINMTWVDIIGGCFTINPRFYSQVPDSHQLMKAARKNEISLARELIYTNSASALCMTSAGWTPLHFAAAKGHLDMCNFLISHGADLNAVGYIGMTPLHAAATFGRIEVMKLLITKGSDPNIFHDHGFNAIFQLFTAANTLEGAKKLALMDWVLSKQEHFQYDIYALDVLRRNLTRVIIQSGTGTPSPCGIQQSRLVHTLLKKNLSLDNMDFEGSTVLHEAAKLGRLDIVDQLLNRSATPTIRDNRGRMPMHYAAESGNVAIVRRLLEETVNGYDHIDNTLCTPLRLAVKGHHLDTVILLLDFGAKSSVMCLEEAVISEAKDIFDLLLSIGSKPSLRVIAKAIQTEDLHYLRSCLRCGSSPNSSFGTCYTPLTLAVSCGRTPALQLLLSMGADVNFRPGLYARSSALLLAVRERRLEMVDILLRAGARTDDLSMVESPTVNLIDEATRNGYTDIAEILNEAGAPKPAANQPNDNTNLDIASATARNRVDILKELICQGVDVNKSTGDMWRSSTPLMLACMRRNSEAAIVLVEAGADVGRHSILEDPPLFVAARAGLTNVVQTLLEKGADINQLFSYHYYPPRSGQTALIYMLKGPEEAIEFPDPTIRYDQTRCIVQKLILAGIDVNVVDSDGCTALGLACWHGFRSIVEVLIEAGADISIPSSERHNFGTEGWPCTRICPRYLPLELAAKAGHEDIVQLLLAKGANWRSLKQEKAIATSHAVLVQQWFADDTDDDEGDEETIFLGCEPPEAQLKVSCAQAGTHESANANYIRQRKLSNRRKRGPQAKKLHHYLLDLAHLIHTAVHQIESWVLHLCVGILSIIVVSLLLLYHKIPFSTIQRNGPLLRVLLWAMVLRFVISKAAGWV